MENEDIRDVQIGDLRYDGFRETNGDGHGYIELRESGGGNMVVRIAYDGPDLPMRITTDGNNVPRPVVEHLMALADEWLA